MAVLQSTELLEHNPLRQPGTEMFVLCSLKFLFAISSSNILPEYEQGLNPGEDTNVVCQTGSSSAPASVPTEGIHLLG